MSKVINGKKSRNIPDDVSEEGECLDLCAHEVDEDLLVEGGALAKVGRGLQADRVHDQRNKLFHLRVF